MTAIANEMPEQLQSLRGELPSQLLAVVDRMMAKQPAKRYDSPEEVIQSLTPWSRGADLAALLARARAAENLTPPPRLFREPRPVAATPPHHGDSRSVARSGSLLWAALALVACMIGLIAFVVGTRLKSTPLWHNTHGEAAAPNRNFDPHVRSREVAAWILEHPDAVAVVAVDGQEATKLKTGDALPDCAVSIGRRNAGTRVSDRR